MARYNDIPEGALDFLTKKKGGAAAREGSPDNIAFNAMKKATTSKADSLRDNLWIGAKKDWYKLIHSGTDEERAGRLRELRAMMDWGKKNKDDYWYNLGPQIGGYSVDRRGSKTYHKQEWTPEQEEYRELLYWEENLNKKRK
jgi:hypothetical protein|tara:strand:- start:416 stop:841 length:426 start_codon:yes stop_codon:yes gene_type:complete